uniref:Uncharacterized protein n=1 Tax=Arundo donax TaxID=35708 RepID=A0A0A8YHT9_ARUDO
MSNENYETATTNKYEMFLIDSTSDI